MFEDGGDQNRIFAGEERKKGRNYCENKVKLNKKIAVKIILMKSRKLFSLSISFHFH